MNTNQTRPTVTPTPTPGPWHVRTTEGGSVIAGDFVNLVEVIGADGTIVASNEPYYPQAVTEPDARLIAAAPELRDALSAFCAAMESGAIADNHLGKYGTRLCGTARALLARLTE